MTRSTKTQPSEFMTSAEVARHLRINPKKVYALLAEGKLPGSRISGKWIFPRTLVDRWVAEHTIYPTTGVMNAVLDRLLVIQGSDDPLLAAALEATRLRTGIAVASAPVGSMGGIRALAAGSAHVAGFHVDDGDVLDHVGPGESWWVVSLGTREQGLMFASGRAKPIGGAAAVAEQRLRLADRQPDSGTYRLTRRVFREAGADADALPRVGPYSSHLEVGLAVRNGLADVGVGVRVVAEACRLDFVPLAVEAFKLAVPGSYFNHQRLSAFLDGLLSELGETAKRGASGYSFESLGRIRPLRRPRGVRVAGEGGGPS